jgi:peptidoglycan/LPS O-acetylase OafA/YrhL
VSINIERILQYRDLPARAAVTLILLVGVLVVLLLGLAHGQSHVAFGAEVLGVSLVETFACFALLRSRPRAEEQESHIGSSLILTAMGTLPFVLAGASLLAHTGGGLYWVIAAMILAIVGAVANAWVLLVEILR